MDLAVITRDNTVRLRQTLRSVRTSSEASDQTVYVVDDSPHQHRIDENRACAKELIGDQLVFVSRTDTHSILECLCAEAAVRAGTLAQAFELGKPAWNTYAARNVALVVTQSCFAGRRVLFLDDDVDLTRSVIDEAAETPLGQLSAFALSGLPDFSRTKWFELFFTCAAADKCDSSAVREGESLLANFTDAWPRPAPRGPTATVHPLPWNAVHGAAFACSLPPSVPMPLFPPFHGEDYYWSRRLRDTGVQIAHRQTRVRHNGARRQLSDCASFEAEELGAIECTSLRVISAHSRLNVRHTLRALLTANAARLTRLHQRLCTRELDSCHQAAGDVLLSVLSTVTNRLRDPAVLDDAEAQVNAALILEPLWQGLRERLGARLNGN